MLAVPAVLLVGSVVLIGGHDAQALLLWPLLLLGAWRLVHTRSFERLVGRRLRGRRAGWWVYQRRWKGTMAMSGLTKRYRCVSTRPSSGTGSHETITRASAGPDQLRQRGVPEQLVQMAAAFLRIAERRGLQGIGRWVHMLGFRGHFVTKSRGYSTTLGALRDARAAYRAEQDEPAAEDEDSTLVVAAWEYVGSGYLNPGDVLLAAGVEASLRAARAVLADLRAGPGRGAARARR